MTEPTPNIVYIMTDQQSADAMSCTGNPHLHTPAVDRLAADGVRFDAAYAAYPLCVPARTAMFSGRMPHELGIYSNVPESPGSCPYPMLGKHLADAGYRTHYVGKWHLTVPEDALHQHGFEQITCGGSYGGLDRDKASAAIEYIQSAPPEPFFLTVSFNNPHDACELARDQDLKMGPLPPLPPDNELPPAPDNMDAADDEPSILREFQRENPGIGCALNWDETKIRQFRWGYNRLVEMVDADIGRVLDALRDHGLWDNTLVVFTSDHGDGQGAHHWNQKWCHYDESSRVPFIVVDPRRKRAGEVETHPVSSTLDLYPTLCEYAGVEPPDDVRGRSVRPLIDGQPLDRRAVASETTFSTWGKLHEDAWPKARMIRTPRYKYIAFDSGAPREQLFALETDPGEKNNLAADPDHADVLAEHRQHLRAWIEETNDTFDLEKVP